MRISIRHSHYYLIEFDQIQVSGRRALGGYAFTLTLHGKRSSCELPVVIFDISLSLSTVIQERPIISLIPSSTQLIQCGKFAGSERVDFSVVFTKEQLNALEEYRQEKDLPLKIGLSAITSSNGHIEKCYDHADITIPREHWLNALRDSGFRQTVLFEVALPEVDEEFSELISKAQNFIETGHYKEAVIQCRHIVERIEEIRDDKTLSLAANKKSQNKQEREEMTVIERMLSVREHLKIICHLGAHGREFFTRSQAKAVLGMTMALLAEPTVGFMLPDSTISKI